MLRGWLNSDWLRVVAYLASALVALAAARREEHWAEPSRPDLWPMFWYLTSALLVVMAIGRATDVGELVSEFGRRQARSEGWYRGRRSLQTLVVGSVGAIWFVTVVLAIWRVPERRRRYLPMAIVVFTLMCFAAIRIVSLHQVDSVLYRHPISGVKIAALVELGLIGLAIVATAWRLAINVRPRTNEVSRS